MDGRSIGRAPLSAIGQVSERHLPYDIPTFAGGAVAHHSDLPRTDLFLALAFFAVVVGGITASMPWPSIVGLGSAAARHWRLSS